MTFAKVKLYKPIINHDISKLPVINMNDGYIKKAQFILIDLIDQPVAFAQDPAQMIDPKRAQSSSSSDRWYCLLIGSEQYTY